MNCLLCENHTWKSLAHYDSPDKYEQWCGIKDISRYWVKCSACGLIYSTRNYHPDKLLPIYVDGYRDVGFRYEKIDEVFNHVLTLAPNESENEYRYKWFDIHTTAWQGINYILDIGSGFGIWPYKLKKCGYDIQCIEPNKESADFIANTLNILCACGFFTGNDNKQHDVISCIHVLEHIKNPDEFLQNIKKVMKPNGRLFIEVPDAIEFEQLPLDHDEFNSCHLWFFDVASLYRLLEQNGFHVIDIHRHKYEQRNLSRIFMICSL